MQDTPQATKTNQSDWEEIKGAGGSFLEEMCDAYPTWDPKIREGMERVIEHLLFFFHYDQEMVERYVLALKRAAACDRGEPAQSPF